MIAGNQLEQEKYREPTILREMFGRKKYEESTFLGRLAVGWRRLLFDVSRAIVSLSTGFPLTQAVGVCGVWGCNGKREEGPEEREGVPHVGPG